MLTQFQDCLHYEDGSNSKDFSDKSIEEHSGTRFQLALDVVKGLLPWIEHLEDLKHNTDDAASICSENDGTYFEDASIDDLTINTVAQQKSVTIEDHNQKDSECGEQNTCKEDACIQDETISNAEAHACLLQMLQPLSSIAESAVNDSRDSIFNVVDTIFPPIDGAGMFPMICKMNHSCDPNVST